MSSKRCQKQRGFTLVEAVLTMVILSIAALSMGQTLGFAFQHSSDGLWQAKTVALAEAYLEEILARRYDEAAPPGGVPPCSAATTACSAIGPDAGESRETFDDVDDYHGLAEAPPEDATGAARVGFDSYSAGISVRYLSVGEVGALGLDDATDGKHIEVTITPPGRSAQSFSVIRGNY
ncbi:MAG: type IV pilus modification PilV family protein [Pseudomonadales bacterium]